MGGRSMYHAAKAPWVHPRLFGIPDFYENEAEILLRVRILHLFEEILGKVKENG
jgi:hypothetical protein